MNHLTNSHRDRDKMHRNPYKKHDRKEDHERPEDKQEHHDHRDPDGYESGPKKYVESSYNEK